MHQAQTKRRTRSGLHHRRALLCEHLESRELLATFRVNSIIDSVATNLRTGKDATGLISLRSALMAAESTAAADTILLPAGEFKLSLFGPNEDGGRTGDLDIHRNVTIRGQNAAVTVIDGNPQGAQQASQSPDRIFHVHGGTVVIERVTIQLGRAQRGAGILIDRGKVTLRNAILQSNAATGDSGAEGNPGGSVIHTAPPTIKGVPASNAIGGAGSDGQNGSRGEGGGIYNAGTLDVINTSLQSNAATGGVGGTGGAGGTAQAGPGSAGTAGGIARGGAGGIGGNGGDASGGGIFNARGATLTVTSSIFKFNLASGARGGGGGAGGQAIGGAGGGGSQPGSGGAAISGAESVAGNSGDAFGGGLFNAGIARFLGGSTSFLNNRAIGRAGTSGNFDPNARAVGGAGGNGSQTSNGARGGDASVPKAMNGGDGGDASGGAVFNATGALLSASSLLFNSNSAQGGDGGPGGFGAFASGGRGGNGGNAGTSVGSGGNGGDAVGGDAGIPGNAGVARGGAVFNALGARFTIAPPKPSSNGSVFVTQFLQNEVKGALALRGASGGVAGGGAGGNGAPVQGPGGDSGNSSPGDGGDAPNAGPAQGGAFFNQGVATFIGVLVKFEQNKATTFEPSIGGERGLASPGSPGQGITQGSPGIVTPGVAGNVGVLGLAHGGAIYTTSTSELIFDPRKGARRGSARAKTTSSIRKNTATGPLTTSFGGGIASEKGAKVTLNNSVTTENVAETGPDNFELLNVING
jgi:hypothetical protein